jgi:uncharacterized protein (TIGR03382 family)
LVADGFDERRLSLSVTGGSLAQAPARLAPGLYGFQVTAPDGSGGRDLDLQLVFDGRTLARRRVPIGVDRWAAEGEPIAHGGCATTRNVSSPASLIGVLLLALVAMRRRRSN